MANVKLTDLMRPCDGTGQVVEWLDKFDLLVKLRDIKNVETVLPMFLEGSALAVYTELSEEEKTSAKSIREALLNAFSVNPFRAYEQFSKRVWRDEPVDVYMTELRKLARLAGITSDKLLLRAFVVGLPSVVSRELRATAKIESLALSAVVERARALMSELMERPCVAAAGRQHAGRGIMSSRTEERVKDGFGGRSFADGDKQTGNQGGRRCYECGGPHLVRYCPKKDRGAKEVKCWTCGGTGHLSRACPSGQQGNASRGACAPEASQGVE